MRRDPAASWMDGLLEAIWIVDPDDLTIRDANAAAVALLGLEREAMVGQSATAIFNTPEDISFWDEARAGAGAAVDLRSYAQLARRDGSAVHVERRVSFATVDGRGPVWIVGMADRTQQQVAEDELETLLAELRATLESTADGLLVCGPDRSIRSFNRRFATMWEVPKDMLVQRDDEAVHVLLQSSVVDPVAYSRRLTEIFNGLSVEAVDALELRSGKLLQRVSMPQFSHGRVIGRVFSFRDLTERSAADEGLRLAAKVFESSPDAVFIADAQHRIVSVNPSCCGVSRSEAKLLHGSSAIDLFQDHDAGRLFTEVQKGWASAGRWEGEVWHRRGDGTSCPVRLAWVVLRDADGAVSQSIGFFRDLTAERASQQRIEELAFSDVLTGLPNRLLLARRVERAMQAEGKAPIPFAVLFLDLDRFKNINDSLGHQFGDRVLVRVAERIKSCLRLADTLCRLGGDEFVVHLHGADALSAEGVAQRILHTLAEPIKLDDMRFTFTCSIGVALYPQDGRSLDDLVRHADTAMFRVKEHGRASYRFYQPQMNVHLLSRVKMEHGLRDAMERRQFTLHYQPQIDMRTGELIGAEALIRWTDPELGSVSPAVFIPIAEESGYIVTIGAWVMEEAVRQASEWARSGQPLAVSVNVSALQFRQADFIERVAAALRVSGLAPHLLELELTESILLQDAEEALGRLHGLAALGVKLAVDDFGTGYSSLAYLKRFPIHRLKIDQSFVRGLPDDASDRAIVSAMTSLAQALHFDIVAEGVETAAQRDCLRELQCVRFQGFLCAPAMPAAELARRRHEQQPFFAG